MLLLYALSLLFALGMVTIWWKTSFAETFVFRPLRRITGLHKNEACSTYQDWLDYMGMSECWFLNALSDLLSCRICFGCQAGLWTSTLLLLHQGMWWPEAQLTALIWAVSFAFVIDVTSKD